MPPRTDLRHPPGLAPPGKYILGQPDLAEQLIRALNLKGYPPSEMDARVDSMLLLDSLLQPEYQWLRRWQRMVFSVNGAAVAAQFTAAVFCPQLTYTGRSLAVVEGLWIRNTTAAAVSYGMSLSMPAVAVTQPGPGQAGVMKDDRAHAFNVAGVVGAYGVTVVTNAISAYGGAGIEVSIPAGDSRYIPLGWVLTNRQTYSGVNAFDAITVAPLAVNTGMQCTFDWRERNLLQSELL